MSHIHQIEKLERDLQVKQEEINKVDLLNGDLQDEIKRLKLLLEPFVVAASNVAVDGGELVVPYKHWVKLLNGVAKPH